MKKEFKYTFTKGEVHDFEQALQDEELKCWSPCVFVDCDCDCSAECPLYHLNIKDKTQRELLEFMRENVEEG